MTAACQHTTDFHAHILPGADHGSSSVETSLRQLRFASEAGITRVIATPHFYPHKHDVAGFLDRRDRSYAKLSSAMKTGLDFIAPDLRLGAEVLLCEGIENLTDLGRLTLSGTDILLLELPFSGYSREHAESVEALIDKGFRVVLAHIDRYAPEIIRPLLSLGAKAQLNADALAKLFVRKDLLRACEEGSVVALGSDIHGSDNKAYARFLRAEKKLGGYLPAIRAASDAAFAASTPVPALL